MAGFAYEKIAMLKSMINAPEIPNLMVNNLSEKMDMRDYQKEAFENFIMYYENPKVRVNSNSQIWSLFHMATGSGKTYIMAGLILYLYKQGYRNFLFFVNQSNIVEKTKDNFLKKDFKKYLFAQTICIDGKNVEVKAVDNFQDSDENAINIVFTTVQGLHEKLNNVKENSVTYKDFNNKVVLIADEAHHINADTRRLKGAAKKEEEENTKSWESTITNIFRAHRENILLEFTATCDLKNKYILEKYMGNPAEIIYNYTLLEFRNSGYTKDLYNLRTTLSPMLRTIQAMLLSQYRLKLFESIKVGNSKPVILLKTTGKTVECDKFYDEYIDFINNQFNENTIQMIRSQAIGTIERMFEYFDKNGISDSDLVLELKQSFSEEHIVKIHSKVPNISELQQKLNDLENHRNPYRMIFTVDMLNEGWDVLNLFDIVRLYDMEKDAGNNKYLNPTTIAEAQLIGRGARYFPFDLNVNVDFAETHRNKRKFDACRDNELAICETLYYHCIDESRYINSLKKALKETGFNMADDPVKFTYKLKPEFKNSNFYETAKLFKNEQKVVDEKTITCIPKNFVVISDYHTVNSSSSESLYSEDNSIKANITESNTNKKIKDIDKRIVLKALRQYEVYKFNKLKGYFPNLTSIDEFISSTDYFGRYEINVWCEEGREPNNIDFYNAVLKVAESLQRKILSIKETFVGTTEFVEVPLKKYIVDSEREKVYSNDTLENAEGEGVSQNASVINSNYKLDLSDKDWFVYDDNYGTTEEKKFVKYFSTKIDELKRKYDIVYLIRNERKFHIYSFEDGIRFEPDYILILQKNAVTVQQQQIFIEPKGEHLRSNDKESKKEKFLLEIEEKGNCISYHNSDDEYKVIGLPFYTQSVNEDEFKEAFEKLLKD